MAFRHKGAAAAVTVAVILLLLGGAVIRLSAKYRAAAQRATAIELAGRIEHSLEECLGEVSTLLGTISSHASPRGAQQFSTPEWLSEGIFFRIVREHQSDSAAGMEYQFKPLNGGSAIGLDLQGWAKMSLLDDANEAEGAVWSGPFRTTNGSWMMLARVPAPSDDAVAQETEWVAAGLPLDLLLASSGAASLVAAGFDYQFATASSGSLSMVTGSTDAALESPVQRSIFAESGADEQWVLLAAPKDGWYAWTLLLAELVLVVLLALFAALAAYDLARRGDEFRAQVEIRDRRLREVHLRLSEEIEQREELEKRFSYANFHDALTGLPNRNYFMERLGRALQRARLRPGFVAVIVASLQKFRSIRETLGASAGDELLSQAVARLQSGLRPEDLAVARLADDQFGVLLFEIGSEEAAKTAGSRLLESFSEPFRIAGQSVFTGASMGIALSSSGYEDADELLQGAQMALSKAKADEQTGLALFDPATREQVVTRHQLETDLHRAIERQEFLLHFQPIVSLSTGRVAGMEALLRWRHPLEGLVSPARFIPLAEETGLIVPITRWVLREACRQARAWRQQFGEETDFYISVNLSVQDLRQPDICDYVAKVNSEAGLPAGVLRLELTESMMIGNLSAVNELVTRFRQMGFPLLLDDFGIGYSSLSYLNRFQFDYIKIDRAFVSRLGAGQSSGIVRAIVHLAQDLGTKTIAEGVESAAETTQLQELGCDFAQGFYFSKPLEAPLVEKLLASAPPWQSSLSLEASTKK